MSEKQGEITRADRIDRRLAQVRVPEGRKRTLEAVRAFLAELPDEEFGLVEDGADDSTLLFQFISPGSVTEVTPYRTEFDPQSLGLFCAEILRSWAALGEEQRPPKYPMVAIRFMHVCLGAEMETWPDVQLRASVAKAMTYAIAMLQGLNESDAASVAACAARTAALPIKVVAN